MFFVQFSSAANEYYSEIWAERAQTIVTGHSFSDFMGEHATANRPNAEYMINASDYTYIAGMEPVYLNDFEDVPGISLLTAEEGYVEWEVYVAEGGLYHISILHYTIEGRFSDIQRTIFINGVQPHAEAGVMEFSRVWVNELDQIQRDSRGNDLRPSQVEEHIWNETVLRDAMGTYVEPLMFYLQPGRNTIGLLSVREPMVVRHIRIFQMPEVLSYEEVLANHASPHITQAQFATLRVEGQDAVRKSSATLAPLADTTGPGVYPYSPRYIRINHIGGSSWSAPAAWIEWEVDVPVSGMYHIAMNVRQNFQRGTNSYRRITINGEVPFSEMEAVPFDFQRRWRVDMLGGNEPYLFYLEAGVNTIRMETTLGGYAGYYREIQASVLNLNRLYREIVMITGLTPAMFRDYQIALHLPHLADELRFEHERLIRIFDSLGSSERNTVIRTLAWLLDSLASDVEAIPQRLGDFRIHIGSLGTWMMLVRSQMLSVDAIYILPVDAPVPTNNSGFWRQLWHEIRTLFLSFVIDYNAIGSSLEAEGEVRNIEVWVSTGLPSIGAGRDHASVIRRLTDEMFTPETGIYVNLMLTDVGALLPATVAGGGPDVTLSVRNDVPMDFAFRGAVADISGFPGFDEVIQRFPEAAMVPYTFRDQVFALPETLTFSMLFYRRDILADLGLEPPDTWDDVRAAMFTLSRHHMTFGIPTAQNLPLPDVVDMTLAMFLFQMGGEFFGADGAYSALDSDLGVEAFTELTRFFTDYRLPTVFDFANQFRTGEMPMAVVSFAHFNTLQVFAPEIRGLWGMRPVPGTLQADGTISRAVPAGGSAVIMMAQADDRDAAWEFMRWYTSAEAQSRLGQGLESLLGPAARYPTANLEAFARIPWPAQDFRTLNEQFEEVQGIPQVPGGYFVPRQLRNAFFSVTESETIGARSALINGVRLINREIETKRREFGLD